MDLFEDNLSPVEGALVATVIMLGLGLVLFFTGIIYSL